MGNRSIRRAHKDAAEKRIMQIMRKRDALHAASDKAGELRVPLDEPIFWGYGRVLIVRKDLARSPLGERLLELLPIVQNYQENRRKDFKRWNGDTHCWEEWVHKPAKLGKRRWEKLPERLRCFFVHSWEKRQSCYRIRDPWMFESRRHKLWIRYRTIPDTELEQEAAYWDDIWQQEMLHARSLKVKSPRRNGWKRYARWYLRDRRPLDRAHRREITDGWEEFAAGRLRLARGKEVMEDAEA